MNLESFRTRLHEAVQQAPVKLQLNNTASQLTIVINHEAQHSISYESLSQAMLDILNSLDLGNIKIIKFYGRVAGEQPNWQKSFPITSKSFTEPLTSKKAELKTSNESNGKLNTPWLKFTGLGMPVKKFGWVLFGSGLFLLYRGLTYDTTVASDSFEFQRTHNIGEISQRETIISTGGFLAVCGAIFATSSRDD